MRIGYSFWGFLGDYKYDREGKDVSTPDGNATYGWSIVAAAMEAGHEVLPLQENRDAPGFAKRGLGLFQSFSQWKRYAAYMHLVQNDYRYSSTMFGNFPELDVLLIEWRFPIPGRNTADDVGKPGFQADLLRQQELINHYVGTKTKLIYWDLDGKLDDVNGWESTFEPDAVFETAQKPNVNIWTHCWKKVEPPFLMEDVLQKSFMRPRFEKSLVYIGSRYERDDVIDEWIKPASEHVGVEFHGKWDGDCRERWPHVEFHNRCTVKDFHEIYRTAACVPLLAKRSYMERGFITPRPWEALLFGSLPVGLNGHLGIEQYVHQKDHVAKDPEDLVKLANEMYMRLGSLQERKIVREELAHKLRFMDARNFVKKIEDVVG